MKLKTQFDLVRTLDRATRRRTLYGSNGGCPIKVIGDEEDRAVIVFDTSISSQVLTSKNFRNSNYFKAGLEHLAGAGKSVELIDQFYEDIPLFKEGDEHLRLKKEFKVILEMANHELDDKERIIGDYFRKRKDRIVSPVEFSNKFTRLCSALVIAKLTNFSLLRIMRALDMRCNTFCVHFHPARQLAMNATWEYLYQDRNIPSREETDHVSHLVAQAFIVMGIDPVSGAICANIIEDNKSKFVEHTHRYRPTSFVPRECVAETEIAGVNFMAGDTVYVYLVPTESELTVEGSASGNSRHDIAFGKGVHTCIGKQLSISIINLAEKLVAELYPDGFAQKADIEPDGVFLAFSDSKNACGTA